MDYKDFAARMRTMGREELEAYISPSQAHAMASLSGAMVRVLQSGEFEGRMRKLEAKLSASQAEQGS